MSKEIITNKLVEELKKSIMERRELKIELESVNERMRNGISFFRSQLRDGDNSKLKQGTQIMVELSEKVLNLQKAIDDLDVYIVTRMEVFTYAIRGMVTLGEDINDAGDIRQRKELEVALFKEFETQEVITPDDIWFLKMIKEALRPSNIEIM